MKAISIALVVINHFWAVESLYMTSTENMQFDFLEYAYARFVLYNKFK